ncbi:MAG: hypothetical protein AVDCRST_MAG85-1566 [uncultured Solirubrobacteraceae bacterium]|uniref:Uncharacterized protein n=1 Tax=uncultured Solirubrobacteraceae bacterium TaxID=1162706 RepID=A0A6J4SES6_9ACTN|nr:MAG: hypothetical protein AVDCRST_MAG85-1566 [uncultured Solirubrobacteraceae bacterium]
MAHNTATTRTRRVHQRAGSAQIAAYIHSLSDRHAVAARKALEAAAPSPPSPLAPRATG